MSEDKDEEKPEGEEKEGEEGLVLPEDSSGKRKKLILVGAVAGLLLLGGGGAGLYFAGVFDNGKPVAENGQTDEHGAKAGEEGDHAASETSEAAEKKGNPVFFALGDILVNLSGDGKRPNFLKIKIALELSDEKDKAAIEALKPRIIDNFQVYLRELRVEDLRGSAGLYRLREELLLRVTETAQPLRVRDVLFQEILVQ